MDRCLLGARNRYREALQRYGSRALRPASFGHDYARSAWIMQSTCAEDRHRMGNTHTPCYISAAAAPIVTGRRLTSAMPWRSDDVDRR